MRNAGDLKPKALVSVIVPCFNAETYISDALRSAYCQEGVNLEVIVVDDGSTDRSAEIVEQEFSSARLVRIVNSGPSRARNIGTGLSSGEYIQYLDADDLLAPGKLKSQVEMLYASGADVAYGDWQKLVRGANDDYVHGEICTRKISNPEVELLTGDSWNMIASYLFRRAICERVGGWNEGLPIIQDVRFTLDCALLGARFVYCAGIMAYYRLDLSESVSRRDPIAFVRDCLRNAKEVQEWWESHGGINEGRSKALVSAYSYVARASFEKDSLTFEAAYDALEGLEPGYVPKHPRHLRAASKILGYRNAEMAAAWYRKARRLVGY